MSTPIITSFLDDDLYKFTQGQVIFNQFPRARARYKLIIRDTARRFRPSFADELREQVVMMNDLGLTKDERDGLARKAPWLKRPYLDYLRGFRYNSDDTLIDQESGVSGGQQLHVTVEDYWYRAVLREVKYMATISELYFQGDSPATDWRQRIVAKAQAMQRNGVSWIDFGTRRRFSYGVQDDVNAIHQAFLPKFRGTSNPHFALKYNLNVFGTYAHELVMGMQGNAGLRQCNREAMDAWVREYRGNLGIALSDTVTTPAFLRDFDSYYAKLFDGVRIDSGDPLRVGRMVIDHYKSLGIDPASKSLVFSDSLDTNKAINLVREFADDRIKVTCGIGTHLTNDVGVKPLNMVIKLVAIDFGHGWVELLKLSDDAGKFLGPQDAYAEARRVFWIAV